jgi:hypothetical protein
VVHVNDNYVAYDMEQNTQNDAQNVKNHAQNDNKPMVTEFGTRTVHNQNFSKMVALPKTALENLGENISEVDVSLVQENGIKYIRLTPNLGGKTS